MFDLSHGSNHPPYDSSRWDDFPPDDASFGRYGLPRAQHPAYRVPAAAPHDAERLRAARGEFRAVHRQVVASLLCEAAGMRIDAAPLAVLAAYPMPVRTLASWRQRAERLLRYAPADVAFGSDAAARALGQLQELLQLRIELWPGATDLAQAAFAVRDSELTRCCLGHCLVSHGQAAEGAKIFQQLLREGVSPQGRWRAFEGLANAHEAAGRARLALGAMDAAADEPACGLDPLLSGLYLGIRVGDRERALRAAARLDLLIDPESPMFEASLARLRMRRERLHGEGPFRAPGETSRLLAELAAQGRSPAERVGRTIA